MRVQFNVLPMTPESACLRAVPYTFVPLHLSGKLDAVLALHTEDFPLPGILQSQRASWLCLGKVLIPEDALDTMSCPGQDQTEECQSTRNSPQSLNGIRLGADTRPENQ